MRTATASLVFLFSCSREEPVPTVITPPSSPRPTVTASAALKHQRATFARFEGDELAECGDMLFEGTPVKLDELEKITDGTRVEQSCEEAFKDRAALASCRLKIASSPDAGVQRKVRIHTRFYRYTEVFESDGLMRECLEQKGRWEVLPRDHRAVRDAQRAHLRKRINDLAK